MRELQLSKPQPKAATNAARIAHAPPRRPNPHLVHSVLQRKEDEGKRKPGGCRCESCAGKAKSWLQRKLAIGSAHDPLEREADRVADRVLAMPARTGVSGSPVTIQRAASRPSQPAEQAPESVHRVLGGSGRRLDRGVRQDMEQRFGHDFSAVRVHQGADAAHSARDVNALAYTVGSDIVFGAGQFAPATHSGRRLLAHELAHVVQQKQGVARQVQRLEGPPPGTIDPAKIEAMKALFRQVTSLTRSGAILAEESALISAAVGEAEVAIVAATEMAAAGGAAIATGEGALVVAGGLVADDVTGIGVIDDVAIPFVLLAAAGAFAVGYIIGYSATEISAAWSKAVKAVERAVVVMVKIIEIVTTRQAKPASPTTTSPSTSTPTTTATPVTVAPVTTATTTTAVSSKCPPAVQKKLHDEVSKHCHGLKMACNMQTDTCESALMKISRRYACLDARDRMQKVCWKPGDPGYTEHMQKIAELYAGLRVCEAVAMAKCKFKDLQCK